MWHINVLLTCNLANKQVYFYEIETGLEQTNRSFEFGETEFPHENARITKYEIVHIHYTICDGETILSRM